jgi:nucleoside-diphosphate-sugar epimerase
VLANLASLGFGHAPAIIAAGEEAGIARALFVSTTAIFTSLPVESRSMRMAAEETIKQSAMEWTIIRPTMIYGGPGDRNMERVLAFLRRSPVVPLPGGGDRLLQPVHVGDLAEFVVTLLEGGPTGACYNVAGPVALSLRQVVQQAASAMTRRPIVVSVPLRPVVDLVRVYEHISAHPRLKVEQVLRLNEDKVFDISAAVTLGYSPRPFAEGIASEARLLS